MIQASRPRLGHLGSENGEPMGPPNDFSGLSWTQVLASTGSQKKIEHREQNLEICGANLSGYRVQVQVPLIFEKPPFDSQHDSR